MEKESTPKRISHAEANDVLYADLPERGLTEYMPQTLYRLHNHDYVDTPADAAAIDFNDTLLTIDERLHTYQVHLVKVAGSFESILYTPPNGDERVEFVQGVWQSFADEQGLDGFDGSEPGSLRTLEGFMGHYASKLDQLSGSIDFKQVIDDARLSAVTAADTPTIRRYMNRVARLRFAAVAEQTPVQIIDPLTSLTDDAAQEQNLGSFFPHRRTCTVDPFTISRMVRTMQHERTELEIASLIEAQLSLTVMHELVHAATDDAYYLREVDDDTMVDSQPLWPKYWNEGMTEKLSNVMFAQSTDISQLPYAGGDNEFTYRSSMADSPKEIMSDKDNMANRQSIKQSYAEYRLLIDTIFDKLDWPAAGLTWKTAEQLAGRAFTELPSPDASPKHYKDRLTFHKAISQAAHPGFMMKLNGLVEAYGTSLVMDILTDPNFDPHDPQALPALTGTEQMRELNYDFSAAIVRYKRNAGRLHLMGITASNAYYDNLIAETEAKIPRAEVFKLAQAGLKAELQARHPARRQPTLEQRLLARMLQYELGINRVPRDVDNLDDHAANIQAWIDLNN